MSKKESKKRSKKEKEKDNEQDNEQDNENENAQDNEQDNFLVKLKLMKKIKDIMEDLGFINIVIDPTESGNTYGYIKGDFDKETSASTRLFMVGHYVKRINELGIDAKLPETFTDELYKQMTSEDLTGGVPGIIQYLTYKDLERLPTILEILNSLERRNKNGNV